MWSVTSDCSWEGVSELLHVFSFSLGLIVFSSEDDLDSTLENQAKPVIDYAGFKCMSAGQ